MPITPEQLDEAFATLERVALAGERCPISGTHGLTAALTGALCRAGRIKSEVYAHNWRVIELLTGPNAGKRTQGPPNPKLKPYIIVGIETAHMNKRRDYGAHSRPQPSAPRTLTASDLKS